MRLAAALLAVAVLASACSSTGSDRSSSTAREDDLWRTTAMQDVVTGEEVRIADLEGKVVAIEAMAIWCTTCRTQQLEAQAALEQLDSPDVAYISLDVDPNERAGDLAEYARREGFQWRFVWRQRWSRGRLPGRSAIRSCHRPRRPSSFSARTAS